jgi:hypothetical protein
MFSIFIYLYATIVAHYESFASTHTNFKNGLSDLGFFTGTGFLEPLIFIPRHIIILSTYYSIAAHPPFIRTVLYGLPDRAGLWYCTIVGRKHTVPVGYQYRRVERKVL